MLHKVSDGEFDRVAVLQTDTDEQELADGEYVDDGDVLTDDDSHREEHEEVVGLKEDETVLHKVSDGEFDRVAV